MENHRARSSSAKKIDLPTTTKKIELESQKLQPAAWDKILIINAAEKAKLLTQIREQPPILNHVRTRSNLEKELDKVSSKNSPKIYGFPVYNIKKTASLDT